jgi:ACS family glucarate transporter-like MFS transporter
MISSEGVALHRATGPTNVRWGILALLTCFSLVSYIERINLTVAARFIRDEFRLTDVQIGWSFSAFLIGYTLAQVPAGRLVDRYGSRRVLGIAALAWFALTIVLGLAVGQWASTPIQVITALIVVRFLLGLAEAPTYPGATATIARWFPAGQHGTPNAVIQSASYAGEALTVASLAFLTALWGWRSALFASAIPALLLAWAWWRFGRSSPAEHPKVSVAELELIGLPPPPQTASTGWGVLKDRNVIVLSLSYFCQGYVLYLFFFWFYIYLVDERGFSIAGGGAVAALPTIVAAVCALAGGPLSDRQARGGSPLKGRRRLISAAAIVGALCLLVGSFASDPWVAVGGFALAVGTRGLVESAYWSSVIDIGGRQSGLVGGAMNTMSNLGGAVSTALAPFLVQALGWSVALAVAAAITALSGLILYGLRVEPRSTNLTTTAET